VFQVLAGERPRELRPAAADRLRLGVPQTLVLDELDDEVARAFGAALERLSRSGVKLVELRVPEFDEVAVANRGGGFNSAESYALHRPRLDRAQDFDPRVLERILRGKDVSAADYIDLIATRARLIGQFGRANYDFDAFVMPTVPRIAPPIEPLERDIDAFRKANGLMLRNTSVFNFLGCCAASLPIHRPGSAPVGLMVVGFPGEDERVLAISLALEAAMAHP
jgi:aspartyl-tRNA(Asn)/glutamyl-tRNA(Gln) amidotransferase subunit A